MKFRTISLMIFAFALVFLAGIAAAQTPKVDLTKQPASTDWAQFQVSASDLANVNVNRPLMWNDLGNGKIRIAVYAEVVKDISGDGKLAVHGLGKGRTVASVYLAGWGEGKRDSDPVGIVYDNRIEFEVEPLTGECKLYLRGVDDQGKDVWPWTWESALGYAKRGDEAAYWLTFEQPSGGKLAIRPTYGVAS